MHETHVLIVGAGSVGQRHARNLAQEGCRVSVVEPRADRRQGFVGDHPSAGAWATLGEALGARRFDGVAVCSPTRFHVEQASAALRASLPVLLEKPVSMTHAEALRLKGVMEETGVAVLLGYTWRWWPPLRRVRSLLGKGVVGRVRHVQFHMSAHLADWHPWEPLGDFFMSKAELGGGALLDESHWIDLMTWFFGRPATVSGSIDRLSSLPIDSDDTVDAIVSYADGPRVTLNLDLYGRPHEKFIRVLGEDGTLLWSAEPNRIRVGKEAGQHWKDELFETERNEMFADVAREFVGILRGDAVRTCTVAEGLQVMEIIDALRVSSAEGRLVRLADSQGGLA